MDSRTASRRYGIEMLRSGFGGESPNSGSQNFSGYMYSPESSQKCRGKGKIDPFCIHAVREETVTYTPFCERIWIRKAIVFWNMISDRNVYNLRSSWLISSSENSELHRRPAFGGSFVASSVCALVSLVRPLPPFLRRVLDKDDRSSVLASLVSMQEFLPTEVFHNF